MRSTSYRVFAAVLLLSTVAAASYAQLGIRNISSAQVNFFLNNEADSAELDGSVEKYSIDLNQVILFRVTSWLSGEVKLQRQDEEPVASLAPNGWRETTISVAPIFIVSPVNYIIVRYGLGIGTGYERPIGEALADSDLRGFSHDITLDANYETASVYANLAARASIYPDLDYWFILPTAAVSVTLGSGISVGGRYFFSYSSNSTTDHAARIDLGYQWLPAVKLRIGAVGGIAPSLPAGEQWRYGGLIGADFRINDALLLKYQLDVEARTQRGPRIGNSIVLDARF